MAADDREVERVRAKLYSILDTYTGQTIGEKLRVGEASKLIGLNMSHVPTYAKSGAKYKRRYVITATEEVRSEMRKESLAEEWDRVRKHILTGKRKR